jgi:phage shock protein A
MLKKELEKRVEELEKENAELRQRAGEAELSEEAIGICRGLLGEVGHRGMYFDDVVREAVQEIKALRYDRQRYERMRESVWSHIPGKGKESEAPLRPKNEGYTATWFALAGVGG